MQEVELIKGKNNFGDEIVSVFDPLVVDIPKLAESCKGMKIKGIDDKDGYDAVFKALQSLKKARTTLTGFAKSLRDEYTAKNKKIREIEMDYLQIITDVEDDLKGQREAIDEEKKLAERIVLLPSRKDILSTIEVELADGEILSMDEKSFSDFFQSKKIEYLERREAERVEAEQEKERLALLERMKAEAAEEAKILAEAKAEEDKKEAARKSKEDLERAEKEKAEALARAEAEKLEAIEKLKLEQAESEKKRIEEEKRKLDEEKRIEEAKKAEADRIRREQVEEQAKKEKNARYQKWVAGLDINVAGGDKIERVGDTFIAYKKVGEIIIK